MTRPCELSAAAALALLRERKLGVRELAADCLARVGERDPEVRAFEYLDTEAVLRQAAALDEAGNRRAPLFGLPLGIKDIIDTHDMPTARGSPLYAGHRPPADASCVALARAAGALAFGKTVTTEFAYFYPGKTRNPHNPGHTPGGSSMGSAAAVASGMLPLAFGSQTAASVNRPAAYCGVVGYKASHGQFDLQGVCGLSGTLDTLGVFARDCRDLLLVRQALLGDGPVPARAAPPRIGFCRTAHWAEADAASRKALEALATALQSAGAEISEVELPGAFDELVELQKTIMAFETARARAFEYEQHRDRLSEQFRELVESGRAIGFAHYHSAVRQAAELRLRADALFGDVELLLTPSAPGEAPAGLNATGDPLFSRAWTLLHTPTINLPIGRGPAGLPLGVQLVGPRGGDRDLVLAAEWLQQQLD